MKKIISIILLVMIMLFASACGATGETTVAETEPSVSKVKITNHQDYKAIVGKGGLPAYPSDDYIVKRGTREVIEYADDVEMTLMLKRIFINPTTAETYGVYETDEKDPWRVIYKDISEEDGGELIESKRVVKTNWEDRELPYDSSEGLTIYVDEFLSKAGGAIGPYISQSGGYKTNTRFEDIGVTVLSDGQVWIRCVYKYDLANGMSGRAVSAAANIAKIEK